MSNGSEQKAGLAPEAIQRLVDGRKQFLSFLEKRVQSKAAAEDILQAAFVRSLEKGGGVRDEESVVAWFYRVLRNAIIDYYRQRGTAERISEELVGQLKDRQEPDELFKGEIRQCLRNRRHLPRPRPYPCRFRQESRQYPRSQLLPPRRPLGQQLLPPRVEPRR